MITQNRGGISAVILSASALITRTAARVKQLLTESATLKVNQTVPTENEPELVKSQNLSRAAKPRKDENDLRAPGPWAAIYDLFTHSN